MIPDINTINQASERIKNYVHRTTILTSDIINKIFETKIFFKCENFQKAGSFKSRGACNALLSLNNEELKKGVATHSSGNHAQALARAAYLNNVEAQIVMPDNSPKVKIDAVRNYKGIITFCAPNLKSREDTLKKIISETAATEKHPYNNYKIIAGQATAAKEFYQDINNKLDYIIAPIGGGGLISGTALATAYFSPKTKVIAAEPLQANDAYKSFYQGKFIPSTNPKTIADGLLTSLGSLTFPIVQKYVDSILTANEKNIIYAMRLIWERMKIIIEPSSAVPLACILENKSFFKNKNIGIILSGGNVDLNKLPWN